MQTLVKTVIKIVTVKRVTAIFLLNQNHLLPSCLILVFITCFPEIYNEGVGIPNGLKTFL